MIPPAEYYKQTQGQTRFKRPVSGEFVDEISSGQRKRIAKCERLGFSVELSDIETCHPIIVENRQRKGRTYSMSLDDWRQIEKDAVCFAVVPGPVAVAMCVRVDPEIVYVQGWGDIPGQEQNSPVALLCKGIYEWCRGQGIRVLDVGISDEDGIPNERLIAFKESLGFRA